jgi:hypothetical protein
VFRYELAGEAMDVIPISTGNPHSVTFVDDVDKLDLNRIGPLAERHPAFPKRVNAHWAQVLSPREIRMRTWERGSGITWACGTGASAVVVAAVLTGRSERNVLVHLPAATLNIEWRASDNCIYMTGPATGSLFAENGTDDLLPPWRRRAPIVLSSYRRFTAAPRHRRSRPLPTSRGRCAWPDRSCGASGPAKWELDDNAQGPSGATRLLRELYASPRSARTGEKHSSTMKGYVDAFIDKDGKFVDKTYKAKDYKLDDILPGRLALLLLKLTSDPRYRVAADTLANQLTTQPRTADGGYWHKKTYTHEMWLDGIFMDCPFMAEYAEIAKDPRWFDEAANQIVIIAKHTHDPRTGLYFHGWDESRTERWATKETGTSPHVWGRAAGWYFMGMVETLDRLPRDHARRQEVETIFRDLAAAIAKAQDPSSGVWWQVMDEPGRKGNYLESSASCMFRLRNGQGHPPRTARRSLQGGLCTRATTASWSASSGPNRTYATRSSSLTPAKSPD